MFPPVTAIIPTLCEPSRALLLARATRSLLNATTRPLKILVVVNGGVFDKGVATSLLDYEGVEVIYRIEPSAPLAVLEGRRLVRSEYFCFLDDDDEYLPGAIDRRVEAIREHPEWDFVVSNGYRCSPRRVQTVINEPDLIRVDPLKALLESNWLASCGALFKTDSIGVQFFEEPQPYIEWTWLAFRLVSAGKRLGLIETPTYKINDIPGSLSRSQQYLESEVSLYRRMLAMNSRCDLAPQLERRICRVWHNASSVQLKNKQLGMAFVSHIRSLGHVYGCWKYLPYTWRIFYEALFSILFAIRRKH